MHNQTLAAAPNMNFTVEEQDDESDDESSFIRKADDIGSEMNYMSESEIHRADANDMIS